MKRILMVLAVALSAGLSTGFLARAETAPKVAVETAVAAQPLGEPGIFQLKYEEPTVAQSFVAGRQWLPYPAYADRAGWDALLGSDKAELIRRGERYLDYEWKTIPATAYLAFERTGDRTAMESIEAGNRSALISLITAELAEGRGRFIDQIANGVWLASQQFSWVLSAHQIRQETDRALPDDREHFIDLGSGRFGSIMSVAWYFFHDEWDELDPSISYAVKTAVRKQILDPFLEIDNYKAHWWVGLGGGKKVPALNNWTPWCNSDAILCFLLMEEDQGRLDTALDRTIRSVDMFLRSIQQDGACEEGCSYWGNAAGKLYDWMQIMYDASDGRFDCFGSERIRRMGEYISRTYIGDGYVVNFADASAKAGIPGDLVWSYGKAVGSKEMTDFAMYCLADRQAGIFRGSRTAGSSDIFRTLQNLRFSPAIRAEADSLNRLAQDSSFDSVLASLRREVPSATWYEETEVCYLRNSANWFLAAKGGYNDESHNHNDIGSCVLYIRDIPVLVDAGVGTYTRQTFSDERYDIWTMQSEWHNLPSVNGMAQPYGRSFCSKNPSCSLADGRFSVDLADAYGEEACISKWVRSYALALKGTPTVTISDNFALTDRRQADVERFLVKGEVVLPGQDYNAGTVPAGELLIICENGLVVKMTYPKSLTPTVEEKELDDKKLTDVWGPVLRRISLTSSDTAPAKGSYTFKITEL